MGRHITRGLLQGGETFTESLVHVQCAVNG